MELKEKILKIRDRVIYVSGALPTDIEAERYVVKITISPEEAKRVNLDVEYLRDEIAKTVDREVEVIIK